MCQSHQRGTYLYGLRFESCFVEGRNPGSQPGWTALRAGSSYKYVALTDTVVLKILLVLKPLIHNFTALDVCRQRTVRTGALTVNQL